MVAGKSNGKVYAAKRLNKFNLNMDEFIYAFSKLKSMEMMYGIELTLSIGSLSEIQRKVGDSNLNNYVKVISEHPSDTDDIAFRLYNYLWVTTSVNNATEKNDTEKNDVTEKKGLTDTVVKKPKKTIKKKKTKKKAEPVSDSEDIMPRESFTSSSCNKCNYIYDDSDVYECKDSVCNEDQDKHYICGLCADVCEDCKRHVCFGGHMKYGMQTCGECYYD